MRKKELVIEKNNIPNGWARTCINNCVDILDNQRIPINASTRKQRHGKIPYYGSTGQAGWIDDYLFDEELVILGEDAAPFLDHFRDKAYLISGKSWVNNHAHVLRTNYNIILNKFLCYFLNQFDYHEFVTGTTRLKLNQARMKEIVILIPPLPEQKRIVSKIESIFTQIDAAKERLEMLTLQTKSVSGSLSMLKSSILKQAFEGKLVPQDLNDEPAEFLLKKMHKDSKEEVIFEKSNLPSGWININLDDVSTIILGQSPPSSTYNKKNDGLPFFQGKSDFGDTYPTATTWCNSPKKIAEKNDILISVRAPVGSINISNETCCIGRGLSAIRPLNGVKQTYIFYQLQFLKNYISQKGTGTIFKAITGKQLREIRINLAPHHEQKRIVTKIESIFDRIDAIDKSVNNALRTLAMLKSSVLKQAFEGKLVPQDPNDEPAEILLQKIQRERQLMPNTGSKRGKKNVK